jgi:Glutaredoxin.
MSSMEVIFLSEGDCPNCNRIRSVLNRVRHEYRHVDINEVHPADRLGQMLTAEHGVEELPALIVNGRLRLVGEMPEQRIRGEVQRVRRR